MNRSRIIRSIIAVMFMICCIGMLCICVKNSLEMKSTFNLSYKFVYILMLFFAVLFYVLLKKKLNGINCKKAVEYSYRYIYLIILVLVTRFIAVLLYKDTSSTALITPSIDEGLGSYIIYFLGKVTLYPLYSTIIINTILTFASAFIIKRLVFNITTNEILSAIAAIGYIFIPQSIINTTNYVSYNFNTFFILLGIYIMLKIIDEVKQHKLKNKKYLKLTCLMGICILLDILFGGRFEFWIIILLSSLVISNNVGYVRVNNKREFVEKINNVKARKLMYKMEVITINKLLVVSLILLGFIGIGIIGGVYFLKQDMFNIYTNIDLTEIYNNMISAISTSKNYYIIILVFIIILEILGIILRRKKDTKTTLIKLCFVILSLITVTISGTYTACILDTFMILALILNIGNIYYNRDEKIKLLKAEN